MAVVHLLLMNFDLCRASHR